MNDERLKEIKEKIKIESSNPANNERIKEYLMKPEDCFGRKYNEEYSECGHCQVLASLDGRKEPINVFCKETMLELEVKEEVKKMTDDLKEETVEEVAAGPVEAQTAEPTEKPKKEKKEKKPTEPMAEWKVNVKKLFNAGESKEAVVSKITAEYPDITAGKVAVIYNCLIQARKKAESK